jgi:hypothetical protein
VSVLYLGGAMLAVLAFAWWLRRRSHEIDDDITDPATEDELFEPPLVIPYDPGLH